MAKKAKKAEKFVSIKLPKKLVETISGVLEQRNLTIENYLSITLKLALRTKKPLGLKDTMNFGKFANTGSPITVEEAVRFDPDYFAWLVKQGSAGKFNIAVLDLVEQLTDPQMEIAF